MSILVSRTKTVTRVPGIDPGMRVYGFLGMGIPETEGIILEVLPPTSTRGGVLVPRFRWIQEDGQE